MAEIFPKVWGSRLFQSTDSTLQITWCNITQDFILLGDFPVERDFHHKSLVCATTYVFLFKWVTAIYLSVLNTSLSCTKLVPTGTPLITHHTLIVAFAQI